MGKFKLTKKQLHRIWMLKPYKAGAYRRKGDRIKVLQADVIRIPDPMMHGMRVAILPSKNWEESKREAVYNALKAFHEEPTSRTSGGEE